MSAYPLFERGASVILPLVLEARWYDMIAVGTKREEYRLATEYWQARVFAWAERLKPTNLKDTGLLPGRGACAIISA